jgi:hypothetical protein
MRPICQRLDCSSEELIEAHIILRSLARDIKDAGGPNKRITPNYGRELIFAVVRWLYIFVHARAIVRRRAAMHARRGHAGTSHSLIYEPVCSMPCPGVGWLQ